VLCLRARCKRYGVTDGNAETEKMVDFHYNADGQWKSIERFADLTGSQQVTSEVFAILIVAAIIVF
jgi:hypothetical protein